MEFLSSVEGNVLKSEMLQNETNDLKEQIQALKAENAQNFLEMNKLNTELQELNEKLQMLSAKQREHTDDVSKGMISQSQVVRVKYEVSSLFQSLY